jgi:starch-binding outer membrane protein, SusD/RagB family
MKTFKFKNIYILTLLAATILFTACDKDEYLNPSQASNESVVKDVNGLIALCNGLQSKYSVGRASPLYSYITASGLSTNELVVLNQGNTDEANLAAGKGNVIGNNAVVTRLWEQSLITKANAELILNNIGIVGDAPTKNAITCYANLYRGLALLQLGTFWEQAPLVKGVAASFSPRKSVLEEALKMFEEGATAASTAVFTTAYIGSIDFANTFNALSARVHNMLGNNDKAIEFASKVDQSKKSEFTFDAIARNPIFDTHYSTANVCEPFDFNLGLKDIFTPNESDGRVLFYVKSKTFTATNDGKGFFTANDARIPLYLPGEMILIKAEALARKNDIAGAIVELNKVLTKANDVYGVNAKLAEYNGPATAADVLTEIYKNRCIELYNSGLKLEDSRRFGRPAPTEAGADRTRNFYPYPNSERDNNPNTPADPTI